MDDNGLGLTHVFEYLNMSPLFLCLISITNKHMNNFRIANYPNPRWLATVKTIYFSFYSNAKFKYIIIWYSELIEKTDSLIQLNSEEMLMRKMSFCAYPFACELSIFSSNLYWWLTVCIKIDSLKLKTLNLCLLQNRVPFFLVFFLFSSKEKTFQMHFRCAFYIKGLSDLWLFFIGTLQLKFWNSTTCYLKSK